MTETLGEHKVVLYIGDFTSRCGDCGKNADPGETAHRMDIMKGVGCGARFTHIASTYPDIPSKRLLEMRPDLIVIPSPIEELEQLAQDRSSEAT